MKIEFSRSGGFAPRATGQHLEVDTDDLPPHEARELLDLVNAADIKSIAPANNRSPSPDAFHYRIEVNDGGISHAATASDADMPESLNPLVDWLTERASRKS